MYNHVDISSSCTDIAHAHVYCRMLEYSLNLQNVSFSAVRTVRVLRPLRAINRVPSEYGPVINTSLIYITSAFSCFFMKYSIEFDKCLTWCCKSSKNIVTSREVWQLHLIINKPLTQNAKANNNFIRTWKVDKTNITNYITDWWEPECYRTLKTHHEFAKYLKFSTI